MFRSVSRSCQNSIISIIIIISVVFESHSLSSLIRFQSIVRIVYTLCFVCGFLFKFKVTFSLKYHNLSRLRKYIPHLVNFSIKTIKHQTKNQQTLKKLRVSFKQQCDYRVESAKFTKGFDLTRKKNGNRIDRNMES